MELIPYRVSGTLLVVRPVGRTDFPEILLPFNGIPWASPARGGSSLPPRFRSQAFSTSQRFPSRPKLHGLVSCRNRSRDSSLQSFPLAGDRFPLSRQPGSLAVIHRRAETHDSSSCHLRFRRLPRVDAVAWFPRRLWASFPRAEARFPVTLKVELWNRPVPPASPASKLLSLPRVRSRPDRVSPHQPADTLLGFVPSRAFSFHASDPRPALARGLEHAPFVRRLQASRLKGP
jgi:hypothetical protein